MKRYTITTQATGTVHTDEAGLDEFLESADIGIVMLERVARLEPCQEVEHESWTIARRADRQMSYAELVAAVYRLGLTDACAIGVRAWIAVGRPADIEWTAWLYQFGRPLTAPNAEALLDAIKRTLSGREKPTDIQSVDGVVT